MQLNAKSCKITRKLGGKARITESDLKEILREESNLMSYLSFKERIKIFLIKYFPKLYIKFVKIKKIHFYD